MAKGKAEPWPTDLLYGTFLACLTRPDLQRPLVAFYEALADLGQGPRMLTGKWSRPDRFVCLERGAKNLLDTLLAEAQTSLIGLWRGENTAASPKEIALVVAEVGRAAEVAEFMMIEKYGGQRIRLRPRKRSLPAARLQRVAAVPRGEDGKQLAPAVRARLAGVSVATLYRMENTRRPTTASERAKWLDSMQSALMAAFEHAGVSQKEIGAALARFSNLARPQ